MDLEAEPVDVRALADDALAAVAPEATAKGLEIVAHVRADVPREVVADPARLRQVLLNLLTNAVKFTETGSVVLDVGVRSRRQRGVELHLRVTDTGIGIPLDRLDAIFESFAQGDSSATRRYGGTGLGLAISKRLVGLMGGRLWVDSEPGRGSTFHVSVPTPEIAGPPARTTPAGDALLLVAGRTATRRSLAERAESAGLAATSFATVQEATAWAEGGGRWNVAALDFDLDGTASLARSLRQSGGGALVAFAAVETTVEPGLFDAFLTLPVRDGRWEDALRRLAGDEPSAPAPAAVRPDAGPVPRSDLRVLLVEDLVVNQRVALGLLRSLGIQADVAEDGAQAVEAVTASDYDVVLMDVQMPVMDGLEATRRIRTDLPAERQPRIVALTANALAGDPERCRRAGMDAYLAKPVRLDALRRVLTAAPPPAGGDGQAAAPPPAPEMPAATAELVLAHLHTLTDGDDGLVAEILDAYLRTDRTLVAELAGTPAEVAGAAHKLRAASGTLGADGLAAQAHALERAARDGRLDDAEVAAYRDALVAFREVVSRARALLRAPRGAAPDAA